ncbi:MULTISPECIES: NUDIX hydrolase [unclassified Ruegeria]|uniref:NUDIX hydrolase n=1 Tax=unclassified Ruegeria TaxID=2625375 RepID=UPI001AEAF43C|nr:MULTISPECIES: NUDIX hydrolase [unclassified Ruegeria]
MSAWLRNIWEEVGRPLFLRPQRVQFAALCTRRHEDQDEVLLITSRETGRWIIPKGWPVNGLDGLETALLEAWEEAGVRADAVDKEPVGQFTYDKIFKGGTAQSVLTRVYRVSVRELADDFPEVDKRKRQWFSPAEAAKRVQEPELQALLRQM